MPEKSSDSSRLWNASETARFLGVHRRTLHRYVREGLIPSVPLSDGKRPRLRFSPDALRRWVESRERAGSLVR